MPHQLKPACLRPFCDAWKVTVGRGAWKLSRIQEENIVQIFPKAAFWGCRITLGLPAGDFEFSSGRIESRLHSQVYKNNRNCRSFAHEIPAILCAWRYMSAREHPLSNQQFSQQRLSRQTPLISLNLVRLVWSTTFDPGLRSPQRANWCMTKFLGSVQYGCIFFALLSGYLDVDILYLYVTISCHTIPRSVCCCLWRNTVDVHIFINNVTSCDVNSTFKFEFAIWNRSIQ